MKGVGQLALPAVQPGTSIQRHWQWRLGKEAEALDGNMEMRFSTDGLRRGS